MMTKFFVLKRAPLDLWVCAAIFSSSVFLFADSREYPDKAVLFPSIMLVCMMCLSAYCMARSVGKLLKTPAALRANAEKSPADFKAVCVFGLMTAAYALFTPYVGFGAASLVFIAAGTLFFGEKNKLAVIGMPIATMLFVYGFFIYFLDVTMPFFPSFLR